MNLKFPPTDNCCSKLLDPRGYHKGHYSIKFYQKLQVLLKPPSSYIDIPVEIEHTLEDDVPIPLPCPQHIKWKQKVTSEEIQVTPDIVSMHCFGLKLTGDNYIKIFNEITNIILLLYNIYTEHDLH